MDSFLEDYEEAPAVVVGVKRRRSPATQAAVPPLLHLPFLPPQPGKGGAFVRSLYELLRAALGMGAEFQLLSAKSSASAGKEV